MTLKVTLSTVCVPSDDIVAREMDCYHLRFDKSEVVVDVLREAFGEE